MVVSYSHRASPSKCVSNFCYSISSYEKDFPCLRQARICHSTMDKFLVAIIWRETLTSRELVQRGLHLRNSPRESKFIYLSKLDRERHCCFGRQNHLSISYWDTGFWRTIICAIFRGGRESLVEDCISVSSPKRYILAMPFFSRSIVDFMFTIVRTGRIWLWDWIWRWRTQRPSSVMIERSMN